MKISFRSIQMRKIAGISWFVLLLSQIGSSTGEEIRNPQSFIVNGVNASQDRYPYYVSLRYQLASTPSSSLSSVFGGPLSSLIRPPPPSSLRSPPAPPPATGTSTLPAPFCGGSLISNRLVLTAAHCAMASTLYTSYTAPLPSDFRRLGLNVTSFPNTYLVNSTSYSSGRLNITAYIGSQNRTRLPANAGNPIIAWFVHPYYDYLGTGSNYFYDVAVGLLRDAVPDVPKVKLFNPPGDVYEKLSQTVNVTAIGLGDLQNGALTLIEQAVYKSDIDPNNRTTLKLQEGTLGSLVPRKDCGRALTSHYAINRTDGTGNVIPATPIIISPGQLCVGPAITGQNAELKLQAAQLAFDAKTSLNSTFISNVKYTYGIDPTSGPDLVSLLPFYNDTCQGDSGSPIIIKGNDPTEDVQLGTTSFGVGCGSGIASVYTSVQAFLNSTTFDSFLLDVLALVPNSNGRSNTANLVTSLEGAIVPAAAPPARSADGG